MMWQTRDEGFWKRRYHCSTLQSSRFITIMVADLITFVILLFPLVIIRPWPTGTNILPSRRQCLGQLKHLGCGRQSH